MSPMAWIAALSFATELLKFLRAQMMEKKEAKSALVDVTHALKSAREGDTSELEKKFAQFGFVRKPDQPD